VYFLGKMGGSIPQIVKGTPGLGRVGKQDLVHMIDTELRGYEREFKALNIHLFDEVLELISYVERVLSKPGGHLLLAGRAGVGRRTACQLASHMLNKTFFSPSMSRDYSMKEFKRDLKLILQKTGVEAEKVCLYIEDHQLISSEILEYVNSLISAGESPGLYSPEELEPILSTLHDELRNQYEVKTTFELFVRRVQKNLSIVVSLDNSHPQFLQHCASNPALYNKCSIIWHEGWSREAMRQVAQKEMKDELA